MVIFQPVVGAVVYQSPSSTAALGSSVTAMSSAVVTAASGQSVVAAMPAVVQPPVIAAVPVQQSPGKAWHQSVTPEMRDNIVHNL